MIQRLAPIGEFAPRLHSAQAAGFDRKVIGELSTYEFDQLFAPTIGTQSLAHLLGVNSADIASLTIAEVEQLTARQLASFSKAQVGGLSATDLDAMSAAQIAALPVADLQASVIGSLSASVIAEFGLQQFASLSSATEVAAIQRCGDFRRQSGRSDVALAGRNGDFTGQQIAAMSVSQKDVVAANESLLADAFSRMDDGSLGYSQALAVLQDAAKSGFSAWSFAELSQIAGMLNVAGGIQTSAYVQQMFDNVVLGNSANASWNGGDDTAVSLGNLTALSTTSQFDQLISKWFLGGDMPGVLSGDDTTLYPTSYQTYNLPLFSSTGPQTSDVAQGQIGDCWFMAALAETAQQDPSLIENMITANGNGTYSVALHTDDGVDYVTVNSQLATYFDDVTQFDGSGMEFSNSTNSLWAPLIEKAAPQLSEQGVTTGLDFPPARIEYYELTGGLEEGISLVTGQSYETYNLADDNVTTLENVLGTLQNSLAAGDDVILCTNELTGAPEIGPITPTQFSASIRHRA